MVILETERLVLRTWELSDVPAAVPIYGDPVVMKWWPAPETPDKVEARVKRFMERHAENGMTLWAVERKSDGRLIGHCGYQLLAGGPETEIGRTILSLEIRSVFCVPLVRIRIGQEHETTRLSPKEDTLGVLYMDSREPAGDLSASTREMLQSLAIEISTVLENARLLSEEREKRQLEQELKIARNIQQAMLPPQLPEEGWLVAAGSSVACFDVGGDYFDVMRLSPQRWGAVLADVSGKGVAAALMASLIQGAFFATSSVDSHLSEIVAKVNRYISERAANARFVTVFYCSIGEDGSMRWVNAGHCPALVVHSDGQMETLPAGGPPVGLFPDAEFPESGIVLSPGDKVVIYSDGVSEAHNAAEQQFGEERLAEAVAKNASADAGEMFRAIEDAITTFTAGASQKDDLTLLVLGYQGPGVRQQ